MNARPPSGTRHRPSSGPLRALAGRAWSRPVGAVAVSGALLAAGVTAAHSDPGAAPTSWAHEFLVDSLGTAGDDARGDGVCATATGECTLRAAIEEANTLDAGAGQVRIGVHPDFAGGLIDITGPSASTWMRTTAVSAGGTITGDSGAVFDITAPVTIDLENRLRAAPPNNTAVPSAAVFHINGPHITLQGIDNSWGAETTFYVGPDASDVHITGGSMATANSNAKRFLVVRGGATNVRLSDYRVSGFGSNGTTQGWGFVDGSSASAPVRGLEIEGVSYSSGTSGACSSTTSAGCSSSPMSLRNQTVTDLTFRGNTVTNFGRAVNSGSRLMDLRSAVVGDLTFEGNTFPNPRSYGTAPLIDFGTTAATAATVETFSIADNVFDGLSASPRSSTIGLIHLPQNRALGSGGRIVNNHLNFPNGSASQGTITVPFVHWTGPHGTGNNTTPSGLTIQGNVTRGWDLSTASGHGAGTYQFGGTGAVTVRENRSVGAFASNVSNAAQLETGITSVIVANMNAGANGKVGTWFPAARTTNNTQSGLHPASCTVDFEVAPPTSGALSGAVTELDVFWTSWASAGGDVALGTVRLDSLSQQRIQVALPPPGDDRLAHLPADRARPINPETGAVTGFLRIQTQYTPDGGQTVSSQLSRPLEISGSCRADLTINQAAEQNDPTLARDLHYTVTSTIPLDAEKFTPEAVTLTAAPTADTIDAERLNPRAVSVTPVPDTQNKEFTVVARVDDSAVVSAAIEPGRVTAEAGVTNIAAAASTDREITFTNPLVVDPELLTLITGSEESAEYTIDLRPGAPVPSDDLRFVTAVDARGVELGLTLGSPAPVLPAGGETTGPLPVSIGSPDLDENNQSVLVQHTVTSDDPTYDALVVSTLDVRLFSTNPNIEITKQAFVDVGDSSTPASVVATGTQVLPGARLADGQPVCWVYTVTNTSEDDWASVMTDVQVRDSDTRLGADGLIGTLPELAIGATQQFHACAVLIPSDTRVPA